MSFSVRRRASTLAATAITIGAFGATGLMAPAAHAGSVILWHPSGMIWTDSNAQAECTAAGEQMLASKDWTAYGCRPDPAVSPSAIQLWSGVWVGCPRCVARP